MQTEQLDNDKTATRNGRNPAITTARRERNVPARELQGGEMGRRIRSFDWSQHPLGEPESWPQNLTTALNICLSSRFPIILYWGRDLRVFYNDAYIPIFGTKHPDGLGRTCAEVWAEIWDVIGPMFEQVLDTGEATWSDDQLLLLQRFGYVEEAYFTWSFSPICSDSGDVDGVFTAVFETTGRVLSERRLVTLRELGANATIATGVEEACDRFVETLKQNPSDVPFALIYLLDEAQKKMRFKCAVHVPEGHAARIAEIDLDGAPQGWPIADALISKKPLLVRDLQERFGEFPGARWDESPRHAVVFSIPGADLENPIGALVIGINPRRALDDDYEGFLQLVAGQFSTALNNARSYEKERHRAEALAELDRAKTMFFSNVSHEFRTPLTLMLGPLEETLAQSNGLPAETRDRLEVAHSNSLRLLKLVNTLLDFSRIEAGRIDASYEPTDLAVYTRELASVFRSAMEKAGLRYVVDCPPLPEPIYVDRDMWEKITLNLLSNAFKFTFQGEISVALRSQGKRVDLVVTDTGEGIPADELPRVFERFHRVRATRSRSHEGTGIGLALVRELVRLHGGEVRVESIAGRGTTFTVSIPTGAAHLPNERISSARSVTHTGEPASLFVEEAWRWLPNDRQKLAGFPVSVDADAEASPLAPSRVTAIDRFRHRILLADDNSDMRDYLRRLLAGHGFEVTAVADGQSALDLARAEPPALVVSDVMMPRLDGFALLRALRSDPATRTIPIILLSARAGEEARIEGLEAGADDYIVKPFNARELVARVTTQIELARVRREAAKIEADLHAQAEAAKEQLTSVLAGITDLFSVLDHEWRYIFFNDRLTLVTGKSREELLGKPVWQAFPDLVGTSFELELRRCAAEQTPVHFEYWYPPLDRWFENHVYPRSGGVSIFASDITERKRAEEHVRKRGERLQLLSETLGQLLSAANPDTIVRELFPKVAAHLGVDTYFNFMLNETGDGLKLHSCAGISDDTARAIGRLDLGQAICGTVAQTRQPIHATDIQNSSYDKANLVRSLGIQSYNCHPLLVGDRLLGTLSFASHTRKAFDEDECQFLRIISQYTAIALERLQTAQQLEETVEDRTASLREALAQMEEFSYSVSHDLRAPLRAMNAYAGVLLEEYSERLDETARGYLEKIQRSSDRMNRLTQDVLAYSRVARSQFQPEPIQLEQLVKDVIHQYTSLQPPASDIEIMSPLLNVLGHETALGQVVSNLLNNAVKFVPPGVKPHVRLRTERVGKNVVVWFEDNGIGIKPEHQDRIFQMFQRVHPEGKYEGTGIGLTIVRKAVEKMGGKVGFESDGQKGSRFWVELRAAD